MSDVENPSRSSSNTKWWTLAASCLGTFMLLLDITIVNVALDSIENDLNASFADLQWVVDAYALSLAALLLTFGSLSDIFGRKKVFLFGIALFTLASVACALSGSSLMLNIFRAIQGVGAAATFATSLALIAREFTGKERGTAFGAWGATTGAATAIGPLVGGALTTGFGWEAIFYLNVPLGVVALWLTAAKVRADGPRQSSRIDFPGLVTFSGALFLLIFGLVRGNLDGWSSAIIVSSLVGAVLLLVLFVVIETHRDQPMLDLSLFRVPTFVGASVAAFTLSGSIFALFLYIALYLQNVLQYNPFQTGLRFLPTTVLSFVVAAVAGRLSSRVSPRLLMGGGLLFIAVGLLTMGLMLDPQSAWTAILPGLCLSGIGVGLCNPALASTAIGVVKPEASGMASGANSTFRLVGLATGIAALGAVFQHLAEGRTREVIGTALEPADVDRIAGSITGGGGGSVVDIAAPGQTVVQRALSEGFVHGLDSILEVGAGLALVGAVIVFVTVRRRDFRSGGHAAA